MYEITVRKNIPDVGGITQARYVVAHETANPTATLMDEVRYMERNWKNAFVTHFVGDGGKIIQVAKPGRLSYGAGGKANPYSYAQVELCRNRHHKETFQKNYAAYLWLLKKLRKEANLPNEVDNGYGIVTHHYISHNLGGTNHEDPYSFLREMGISKAQFIKDLKSDTHWQQKDTIWYYEKDGTYHKGWLQLENLRYYFNDLGQMQIGWQEILGKWYYFEESGAMKTGWYLYKENWYYLNIETGEMQQNGLITIKGLLYFFEEDGHLREKPGFYPLTWFVLNEGGQAVTGWYQKDYLWYFLGSDGVMVTGWVFSDNNWYYMEPNGVMLSNCEKFIHQKLYVFDLSGKCLNP